MVLMGLAFVTVPLLVAIGNAMIKLGQLAAESEIVLADSATATLENQRLANLLDRMERNARQYLTAAKRRVRRRTLLTLYDGDQAAFEEQHERRCAQLPSDAHDSRAARTARVDVEGRAPHAAQRRGGRRRRASSSASACSTEATRAVADGMRAAINVPTRNAAGEHALGAAGARVAVGGVDPGHARPRAACSCCSSADRCGRSTARFASSAKAISAGRSP